MGTKSKRFENMNVLEASRLYEAEEGVAPTQGWADGQKIWGHDGNWRMEIASAEWRADHPDEPEDEVMDVEEVFDTIILGVPGNAPRRENIIFGTAGNGWE